MQTIISNNIISNKSLVISRCLGKTKVGFTSSETTNADLCFWRKGSHTQIYYITNLIKMISLFNRLPSQSASHKLFRVGIATKFRFSKIIFAEDKIRWNSKCIIMPKLINIIKISKLTNLNKKKVFSWKFANLFKIASFYNTGERRFSI